ncbi:helix-turn-helix transcriptional regulator, partial [Aeromonas enteropelogenes]|uniref:helix-turn-helix transcriptional regulator n=1 Tax=Aeromonas enteropelogenes TaxID=29489 RepID=UPI003B9E7F5F
HVEPPAFKVRENSTYEHPGFSGGLPKQVSDIGKILGITPRTVTFHLERVIKKLGASNKNQAISLALVQGVVQLNIQTARVANVAE